MTSNAVSYFQAEEAKRSNRAQEQELRRHNVANETQAYNSYLEAVQHNRNLESLEAQRIKEQMRHNLEAESQGRANIELGYGNLDKAWSDLAELSRAHRAQEAELFRSHKADEAERMRHNYATEFQGALGTLFSGYESISGSKSKRIQARAASKQAQVAAKRQETDKELGWAKFGLDTSETARRWVQTGTDIGFKAFDAASKLLPFLTN